MIRTTQMQHIMHNGNEQQEDHGGQAPSVLVVDDSVETLQIVRETLRRADYAVWTAISGEEALKYFSQRGLPHLAVVDINMPPGMDGFEFCERLYQFCDVPVIMLTAVDEADTVVNTIQQFAEDYVIKPFNPGELAARIRRVLQRVGKFPYEVATPVAVDSCLTVDFPARKVMKDHESSSLTPTEARLLYILMRDSGETVETDFLLRRMWPREMTYEDRLHVYIHRLRNKLKKVDKKHQYVISERGIGYRFEPRGDAGG